MLLGDHNATNEGGTGVLGEAGGWRLAESKGSSVWLDRGTEAHTSEVSCALADGNTLQVALDNHTEQLGN